jgi:hypothetical protein
MMSLANALKDLKNAVGDLTSLEVQTYVGEINVVMEGITDTTNFEESLHQAKADEKIQLQLVTKLKFDGDAIVLVPSSAPADYIQKAHDTAIKAGNEVRHGLIALFSDVIGLKVSK